MHFSWGLVSFRHENSAGSCKPVDPCSHRNPVGRAEGNSRKIRLRCADSWVRAPGTPATGCHTARAHCPRVTPDCHTSASQGATLQPILGMLPCVVPQKRSTLEINCHKIPRDCPKTSLDLTYRAILLISNRFFFYSRVVSGGTQVPFSRQPGRGPYISDDPVRLLWKLP